MTKKEEQSRELYRLNMDKSVAKQEMKFFEREMRKAKRGFDVAQKDLKKTEKARRNFDRKSK